MDPAHGIPEPGQIFEGRFRIDGVLGEGGMGVVLRATHALMETPVAIKMLHPALTGATASVARFLREARNAAAIRSEHVGQVLDVARTQSGLPYIVMELLPGVDLAVVREERKRIPHVEAATYILQACVAAAEAHALGIVHRDLKPSNVFLTTRVDGTPIVKLFDFGISKRSGEGREDTETLTATGMALGTPSYMAPEQITDAKNADERADVWSLGAMLYELISGRLPFDGDTAPAVMAAVAAADPAPLGTLCPEVPEALAALVHRCLEKDPDCRAADVVALARGLEPYVPDEYKPLAARVERTRRGPQPGPGRPPLTPANAFRRAIADAPTVVRSPGVRSPAAPPARAAVSTTPPEPASVLPAPGPPPPDYARRTFGVALYVAAIVTVAALMRLFWGDAPPAVPAGSPGPRGAPSAVSTAPIVASTSTETPAVTAAPVATVVSNSPSPTGTVSAGASARPRPSASVGPRQQVPDDFLQDP